MHVQLAAANKILDGIRFKVGYLQNHHSTNDDMGQCLAMMNDDLDIVAMQLRDVQEGDGHGHPDDWTRHCDLSQFAGDIVHA